MNTEQPTPALDDLERMQSVDKKNMLRLINELPEQFETALGIGRGLTLDQMPDKPDVIVISGSGDSLIAVDMICAMMSDQITVPIVSDRGGRLPAYVTDRSLVFVVDYPGKSRASMRVYREATARGARVICVTSGGPLLQACSAGGSRSIRIPPGHPSRTALGYLVAPIVVAIERLGLAPGVDEKLSSAVRLMKNVREMFRFENSTRRNLAKQIAENIFGKYVVVYGSAGTGCALADRWASQFSGNAKVPAFASCFPKAELEVGAWETKESLLKSAAFVFLEDPSDRSEVPDQMSAAKELLTDFEVVSVEVRGATTFERLLYGIYLADYASYYLALLYEVDPTVIESVNYLQAALDRRESEEQPHVSSTGPEQTE